MLKNNYIQVTCNLMGKFYFVKKVVKELREAPASASYFTTAYPLGGPAVNIYRTPAGVMYAKIDTLNY